MRRRTLEEQKRRILNMDFKKKSDRDDWERLNQFLQEKQKEPDQNLSSGATNAQNKGESSFELP